MKHKLCLFLCVGFLMITGCQQRTGDASPSKEEQAKKDGENKNQQPAEDVKAKVVKHAEFLEELKQYKGKVVLVDFWSTSCFPCMEKFPKVVKLYNDHRSEGLVAVSAAILCDDEPTRELAKKFLKKVNSTMPNYILDEPDVAPVQEHWNFGPIPAYFVFGRDGTISKNGHFVIENADDKIHFEDIEKTVLAELGKK